VQIVFADISLTPYREQIQIFTKVFLIQKHFYQKQRIFVE